MSPAGALAIGVITSAGCLAACQFLKAVLRLDDALDVVGVHLVGGALGTLLAGAFASTELPIVGGQENVDIVSQLTVQTLGVLAVMGYTVLMTSVILFLVNAAVPRPRASEAEKADMTARGEHAYALDDGNEPPADAAPPNARRPMRLSRR